MKNVLRLAVLAIIMVSIIAITIDACSEKVTETKPRSGYQDGYQDGNETDFPSGEIVP